MIVRITAARPASDRGVEVDPEMSQAHADSSVAWHMTITTSKINHLFMNFLP
jgi:hypothetical protein